MPGRLFEPAPLAALSRQSLHPWLVVGVTCVGAFIGQLDASIVQLALPALQQVFTVSVNEVRWVAIAYLLAYAACLPVFARLCEMFGRKLLYLAGFALFGIASLLCGLAEDLPTLVACRVLQGMGGSLLGANSIAILIKSVPSDKRAHAIGWFTAAQAIGVSAGPVAGGLLLASLGWQWVFWAAVPFSLLAVTLGWLVLPRTGDVSTAGFDGLGVLLLTPSLLLAVLALNQTSVWPFLSLPMLGCIVAAAAFLAAFVRHERRTASPLIELSLFGRNGFTIGIVGVALGYALLYGMFFLMAYALMHGYHNSAQASGIKLALIPVALGLLAPIGIALSKRWDSRTVGAVGMGLCTASLLGIAAIGFWLESESLIPGLASFVVFGIGLGLFMAPNSNGTIEAAPAHHAGTASALINLMRVLGSCIGVSAASSMMAWRLQQKVGHDGLDQLFGGRVLLDAVESSLVVLVIFALVAGAASLFRPATRPG